MSSLSFGSDEEGETTNFSHGASTAGSGKKLRATWRSAASDFFNAKSAQIKERQKLKKKAGLEMTRAFNQR